MVLGEREDDGIGCNTPMKDEQISMGVTPSGRLSVISEKVVESNTE